MELPDLQKYKDIFTDQRFTEKISRIAKRAGAKLVYAALILYYTLKSDKVSIKDKAISKKIEIAKLLSEIMARKDSKAAVGEEAKGASVFDVNNVKKLIRNFSAEENNKIKTIELNKK